jgi:hypothetical protein
MPYQHVPDFRNGMDRTRPLSALEEGVLYELRNAHISRGGDIEKRKAWVSYKTLPAGTFGFHSTLDTLYVFGSGADPGVPAGVTYQRLQSPYGASMTEFLSAVNSDGKVYAIARYSDGKVHHFFDGELVTDWEDGIVVSNMANTTGIATHLKAILDRSGLFTVTQLANVLTIEKLEAGTFTIDEFVQDENGEELEDALVLVQKVEGNVEVLSSGSFTIISGIESAGVNYISSIKVNGVEVLGASVNYVRTPADTARAVALQINTYASVPEYTAVAIDNSVNIIAAEGTGAGPNGYAIETTTAGRFIVNTGGFGIIAGSFDPGINRIDSVQLDGVDLLAGTEIDWTTSHTVTAAAVATQVNTAAVSDFLAFNEGNQVKFYQLINTAMNPPDTVLFIDEDGDVEFSAPVPISSTIVDFAGGQAAAKEKWEVTVAGPYAVGDRYTLIIDGLRYGAQDNPPEKGLRALTFGSKIYTIADSLLIFSAVNDPEGWNATDDPGAGTLNISTSDGGSQDLVGLEAFQGGLAVFSRRSIQLLIVDTNPINNRLTQVVKRTGLLSKGAVLSVNELDTFYLADSGIRSLRPRDASSAAIAVDDIGTAIDMAVLDKIGVLSATNIAKAVAIIEPKDERFLLFLGTEAYVLSYFRKKNIVGWSVYDLPGVVDFAVEKADELFIRVGNTIYLYGGTDGATYDSAVVTAQFSFFTAKKPSHRKGIVGFDIDCENEWKLDLLVDPEDLTQRIDMGTLEGFTYQDTHQGAIGQVTHVAPKLICEAAGYARVSSFSLHYEIADVES